MRGIERDGYLDFIAVIGTKLSGYGCGKSNSLRLTMSHSQQGRNINKSIPMKAEASKERLYFQNCQMPPIAHIGP
jgi:hypothetical protein